MTQEQTPLQKSVFADRLLTILREQSAGSWKDGWVYGRLKQEFDLQSNELEAISTALKFKYGWNKSVEEILERQWQEEEPRWLSQKLAIIQKQADLSRRKKDVTQKMTTLTQEIEENRKLTEVERILISLILKMNVEDQEQVMNAILDRHVL